MPTSSPTSRPSISATHKGYLRAAVRHRRTKALPHADAVATGFEKNILEVTAWAQGQREKNALTIAAYLPLAPEPPITATLEKLHQQGHRILVPVVEPARQLSWVYWTPSTAFVPNSMGIQEPTGARFDASEFRAADVRLIPALAYDVSGARLGQGGGYYDRILTAETYHDTFSFGVVFENEVLDALPTEEWDAKVSQVITEQKIHRLS